MAVITWTMSVVSKVNLKKDCLHSGNLALAWFSAAASSSEEVEECSRCCAVERALLHYYEDIRNITQLKTKDQLEGIIKRKKIRYQHLPKKCIQARYARPRYYIGRVAAAPSMHSNCIFS